MWTIRSHVDSLAELDRDIKLQLEMFRDASRLATDNVYLERTYRIEQAIERLVAERCDSTGESKATAIESLSKDAAAVETVGAHIPDKEFAAELREFHIELRADVKELLRRDSSLRKKLLRRDSSLKKRLGSLANSLTKKTQAETVRSLKSDTLAQLEVTLDSVEDVPFAQGGQGEVFNGTLAGEEVCLKKVSLVGCTAAGRERLLRQFKTELLIMARLHSPRTVRVLGVVSTDPRYLGLVMEYMSGGSVQALIASRRDAHADGAAARALRTGVVRPYA